MCAHAHAHPVPRIFCYFVRLGLRIWLIPGGLPSRTVLVGLILLRPASFIRTLGWHEWGVSAAC
jgi:hypothetical protein